MRALDRLTNYNIKARIEEIKKLSKLDLKLDDFLSGMPQTMSEGYTKVLTPNGIMRKKELDHLLSIDSDIVTCLVIIGREKSKTRDDVISSLKELIEERKKLIETLKV
jgi:hypothetical protein